MVKLAKKIIFKLYVIALMVFTVWYGHFMYPLIFGFEGKEAAGLSLKKAVYAGTKEEKVFERMSAAKPTQRKTTDLGYRLIDQPYIKGRFHHIGFTLQPDKANMCMRCHGNAPHAGSKETRAFLNMHSFYLACETCHSVPGPGEPAWTFGWYDKHSGKPADNPRAILAIEDRFIRRHDEREYPVYGDYGARIAPATKASGKLSLLHDEIDMVMVKQYLEQRDRLDAYQKAERKKIIHANVSERALACEDCHQLQSPYIPFAELGYPLTRMRELTINPVVGMLNKYEVFYLPSYLIPHDVEKNKFEFE